MLFKFSGAQYEARFKTVSYRKTWNIANVEPNKMAFEIRVNSQIRGLGISLLLGIYYQQIE